MISLPLARSNLFFGSSATSFKSILIWASPALMTGRYASATRRKTTEHEALIGWVAVGGGDAGGVVALALFLGHWHALAR